MNPLFTALVYCIIVSFAIEAVSSRGRLAEDTAIGIFFSASMAMGVLLISMSKSYTVDLFGYLFGSILAISKEEAYLAVATAIAVILIFSIIMRDLLFVTFNEELAVVNGIPVRLIKSVFLVSMAVAIVIGIKIVGIILISALLVIPGATAKLLTQRFYRMLAVSCAAALLSTVSGLFVSYLYDLAPGGTIVMILSLFFGIAFAARLFR
jgi:zinc transport system permease protein